ncbi:MAG: hypothetical protein CVU64_15785 [Deltaproteobacteria bacterium HGW-Deltaproteobacteria-21]|nr:MAG: hypothetical protein CVU64_15785 [Deltaproteobacteria bacterium HGW-Deltaproteobacteria-21]
MDSKMRIRKNDGKLECWNSGILGKNSNQKIGDECAARWLYRIETHHSIIPILQLFQEMVYRLRHRL